MDVIFDKYVGLTQGMLTITNAWRTGETTYVECRCDCGNQKIFRAQVFRRGVIGSCGCLNKASGNVNTPTYYSWAGMKQRCLNPATIAYPDYGGRGIKICDRWLEFSNFLADMGERPEDLELDRIDVNGDYEPDNCRWVARMVNIQNRRNTKVLTIGNKTKTWVEWAAFAGISRGALKMRLQRGWTPEQAVGLEERDT